jgi:hypothetical protein
MSDIINAIECEYSENKLVGAIQATGLVKPGLESDVAQLIGHGFTLSVGESGKAELQSKSGKPVREELAETLGTARFEHFRGERGPGVGPDGTYDRGAHIRRRMAELSSVIGLCGPVSTSNAPGLPNVRRQG